MPLVAALALSGCSSFSSMFSGLSGSTVEHACKAPDGVSCSSVSGNYANAVAGNLPGQKAVTVIAPTAPQLQSDKPTAQTVESATETQPADSTDQVFFSPRDIAAPRSGDPVRMAPLVLRIWFAPWEDADGDLHDQHYVYAVMHHGKWLIEANRQAVMNAYRPVYPLNGAAEKTTPKQDIPAGFGLPPTTDAREAGE